MQNNEIDELYNRFSGKPVQQQGNPEAEELYQRFSNKSQTPAITNNIVGTTAPVGPSVVDKSIGGVATGILNVTDTIGKGINYASKALTGKELDPTFDETVAGHRKELKTKYGEGLPVDIGTMAGEIAATGPFIPAKMLAGGANILMRATPTILSTGETIAPSLVKRIGSLSLQGGIIGGEFNALTHSARPEKSLLGDAVEGLATGLVAAPVTQGALVTASKLFTGLKNSWANLEISKFANDTGISAKTASNVIDRLKEAGFTPQDAATAIKKLGPNATLADLETSLTTEASGLASFGGKPTSILKGTFEDRAATANTRANDIIETRLGPKPDIAIEKENIVDGARKATSADYDVAHKSPKVLDTPSVVKNIENTLDHAVGKEAAELEKVKGYLYDKDGNLKTDVKSLHKVRQAIDDRLGELPKEGTSLKSSTYRSLSNIRSDVDAQLKSIPEMANADMIFSQKMQVAKGLDIGYNALKSGTKEEFEKAWTAADPLMKETIKKGLRAAIGDALEAAQRGELSGAQRLFGAKSVNREKLKLAYGSHADEVLNELQREAAFRATENAVKHGAQTAERQAVQRRYGERNDGGGTLLGDAVKGLATDLATGSPAIAAGTMAVRNIGRGLNNRLMEIRSNNVAEGTADILSRQGAMRDSTLDNLGKINQIRDRLTSKSSSIRSALPVRLSEPLAEYIKDKAKNF